MIEGKKILAVIPARGGSKGLPRKNILPIGGKPLIAWSIEKAKKSKFIDLVFVSTDCPEISSISNDYGGYIPILRPDLLARDETPSIEVVDHVIKYLKESESREFDILVLLEPTSPLREDDDIDRMLQKFVTLYDEYDSIVSIGEISEHPSILLKINGNSIERFSKETPFHNRRQLNQPVFFPYGVAYISKVNQLLKERNFYTKKCTFFKIKRYQNYEIDDIYDFFCVEAIMKYQWNLI